MTQKQDTNDTITEILREFCCKYKREEEERRRRYEEWRKRKLGDCYAERLDYSIGEVVTATIGESIVDVLKPGDRLLIALNTFDDPCMLDGMYAEGYVPVYGERCRCKRSEYDVYAIVQLPLYVRRSVLRERKYTIPPLSSEEQLSWFIYHKPLAVSEYRDNGVLEIVDTDDYDYYLHMAMFGITPTHNDPDVEVEGAAWHSVYYVMYSKTIYDQRWNKIAELDICCYDEVLSYLIALMLVKRSEVARMRYYDGEKRLEHAVVAAFPPVAKLRRLTHDA